MDYKKKLKQRLYIGIIYIALGVMIIVGVFSSKSNNDFVSALGFAIAMVGVARIIQYLKITKNEDSIKKQKINESDERNRLIGLKSWSYAGYAMFIILYIALLVAGAVDVVIMNTILVVLGVFALCLLISRKVVEKTI